MIDSNTNPHEAAVAVLENCRAKGERLAHDESIVVLADLYKEQRDEKNNQKRSSWNNNNTG